MMRRTVLPVLFLVALVACGDDATAPNLPSVRGNYAATWTFTLTLVSTGESASLTCPGSLSIANQSDRDFSGSFTVQATADCDAVSGTISGTVRTDGGLNFSTTVPGAGDDPFETVLGCQFVGGDSQFNGTLSGDQLTASASASYDCPFGVTVERLNVRVSVSATRA
jgi:hypothetical protein